MSIIFREDPEFIDVQPSLETKNKIHIRLQKRTARNTLTTIQGLPSTTDKKTLLREMKKKFSTNGAIINDTKYGEVIQLQGDKRNDCLELLIKENVCEKDNIQIHGF